VRIRTAMSHDKHNAKTEKLDLPYNLRWKNAE
jgi:hypothetical protein